MIVREDGGSLLLIRQPDHAALASRIMAAWTRDGFPARPGHETVLAAIAHHDDGWLEIDARPVANVQTGRPFDYVTYPLPARQELWYGVVGSVATGSAYAGALVAHHAVTAYAAYADDPAWRDFFARLRVERDRLLAGRDREQLERDYAFLRLGDLLSLAFCHGEKEPAEYAGYTFSMSGDELVVRRDPFSGSRVPLAVEARHVPDRRYSSDEDLREAYGRAAVEIVRGTAVGRG